MQADPGSLPEPELTRLLERASGGDQAANAQLVPIVYEELRALAGGLLARQEAAHTLQPTALVHEAWFKLSRRPGWTDRRHFFAVAATAMRQVLIDHARRARRQKRGGGGIRVTLADLEGGEAELDPVELADALDRLGEVEPRYVRVFELHFLAGLPTSEVAEVLGLTQRTVQLDWRATRAFLQRELFNE